MTMYFSAGTLGFYDSLINTTMPQDVVEISIADYNSLLNGQTEATLESDTNGYPILVLPTADDILRSSLLVTISNLATQLIEIDVSSVPTLRDLVFASGDETLLAKLTAFKVDYDATTTALATAESELAAIP